MTTDDELDDNKCPHCGEPNDDGEGFDGYCGNCADVLDENGYWDGTPNRAMRQLEKRREAKK